MRKVIFLLFLTQIVSFSAFSQFPEDSLLQDDQYKSRNIIDGILIDIGFNQLNNNPDILSLNMWRSKGVNLYYFFNIPISNKFAISPGLGLGLDNYSWRHDITINSAIGDSTSITNLSPLPISKSKLTTNYFDIPLELRFSSSRDHRRSFRVAVGGKVGILFKTGVKYKYEINDYEVKDKRAGDFNVNRFRYGLTGRIGYGYVNFFGYYSLNTLFRKDKPFEVTPFMFGLMFSTF